MRIGLYDGFSLLLLWWIAGNNEGLCSTLAYFNCIISLLIFTTNTSYVFPWCRWACDDCCEDLVTVNHLSNRLYNATTFIFKAELFATLFIGKLPYLSHCYVERPQHDITYGWYICIKQHGNICTMCKVGKLLAGDSAWCQLGLMNV